MREVIADMFLSLDGHAYGEGAPAYFGYPGPDLERLIDENVAAPQRPAPRPEAGGQVVTMRHTCATLLLAKGVHPKFVQALLGHGITLDLYSH